MKQFWEIFLPEDIVIMYSKMDGKRGTAEIKFHYINGNVYHTAKFHRDPSGSWHLMEIQ